MTVSALLWREYELDRSIENRNRLVVQFVPNASAFAKWLFRRNQHWHHACDLEDVRSWCNVGMIKAIQEWDPSRETTWRQFSCQIMRREAVDELRRATHWRRSVRKQTFSSDDLEHVTHEDLCPEPISELTYSEIDDSILAPIRSKRLRYVIRQRFGNRRSTDAIAADLNCSPAQISALVIRAIKILRLAAGTDVDAPIDRMHGPCSIEARKKMSDMYTGRKVSESHRQSMRDAWLTRKAKIT